MSDSNFQQVHITHKSVLKAVDATWMGDTLSDDEIEIPQDIDIPQDDADVDAGEAEAARKEEQKWGDYDLDLFRS